MDSRQQGATEAVVISQKVIPYLRELGFRFIKSEAKVSTRHRTTRADVIAYRDEEKLIPYIVVEVKRHLSSPVSLLDPPVQQAFSVAAALGDEVRYLLITDGNRHRWFERAAKGKSLVPLSTPPRALSEPLQDSILDQSLTPVTDPEQFSNIIWAMVEKLRTADPSTADVFIDVMKILVAKVFDEKRLASGDRSQFQFEGSQADSVAETIGSLYEQAMAEFDLELHGTWQWAASPRKLLQAARIIEPYAISSVSPSVRGDFFREKLRKFEDGISRWERFSTPSPLARLLVGLADPQPRELVIDPACGAGGFVVEAVRHMWASAAESHCTATETLNGNVIGIEVQGQIFTMAVMNLILNDISSPKILQGDTLNSTELGSLNVALGAFDVVLLDPPIGNRIGDSSILEQFDLTRSNIVSSEVLFLEQAVRLLTPGGRLSIIVPDSFLVSRRYEDARNWLLENTRLQAIISLPPGALLSTRAKVSVLFLEKSNGQQSDFEKVLLSKVEAVGYDGIGRPTEENDIPKLLDLFNNFRATGRIGNQQQDAEFHTWTVDRSDLQATRLDVNWLDPEYLQQLDVLRDSWCPTTELNRIVDILGGRYRKLSDEAEQGETIVIRSNAIKEFCLELAGLPYLTSEEHGRFDKARVETGDVLIVTRGSCIGQAAVVERLPAPAVAGSEVAILRPHSCDEIDPFFLATVINSSLGQQQIKRLQLSTTVPRLLQSDLGSLLIPLLPISEQRAVAERTRAMLEEARELTERAQHLRSAAREFVISQLLAEEQDE
jgi:type I restriction enzyme M protein